MEFIYNIVKSNPDYFTWAFGLVNILWCVFLYFSKQKHDKAMEKLKFKLKMQEVEASTLIQKLNELVYLAGEVKEVATSYHSTERKKLARLESYEQLSKLAGQFSKYPRLMQAIRDLNNRCAIMAEDDPHESCRSEVLEFYQVLLKESENVKLKITA